MSEQQTNEFLDDGDDRGMSLEDFLSHSTKAGGGSFLSGDWKDDGEITLWLHRKHHFHAVWFHNWYRVIEAKDRDSGKTKRIVVSVRWNCRDHLPGKNGDKLLRKARFRDDTGAREHPPVACPMCLFEDWLAVEVTAGRIGFADEIFRFSPDESSPEDRAVTLHAGGVVGFFNEKNMTSDEKRLLKEEKIKLSEAWKEKTLVRCNYLVVVVNDAAPEDGPQKFFAPEALGNAMKTAIRKEMARNKRNPDQGNPILNPYPLLVEYDESADFDKKYDASALEDKPSAEVLAEIGGPRVDLSQELDPGNCASLLSDFETYGLIDAPWRSFFAEAEKQGAMTMSDTRQKRAPSRQADDAEETPAKASEPEAYRCDACDGLLPAAASVVCPKCKAVYDESGSLVSLPCLACGGAVMLPAPRSQTNCKACGALHAFDRALMNAGTDDEYEKPTWERLATPPKSAEEKPAAKRGRRGKAAAEKEA